MIQRKQTLFLLLAVIVCALGLFFPIGSIAPEGMGTDSMVYNLGAVSYTHLTLPTKRIV